MDLKDMAEAIIASVMGSPQLEDADREIVLRQLQELHRASLEEAAKLVCLHCRKGLERKVPELMSEIYVHPVGLDNEDLCLASAIWKILEGERP